MYFSSFERARTGVEGLSFYHPKLLYCPDQMLAVMAFSQHQVSSSKTVRPRAPSGVRYMRQAVRSWSAVCSRAPHWQLGEGAKSHLCMVESNCPTSVRMRLSLTQAVWGKLIPAVLVLFIGTKPSRLRQADSNKPITGHGYENMTSWIYSHSILCSIYNSSTEKCGCLVGKVV